MAQGQGVQKEEVYSIQLDILLQAQPHGQEYRRKRYIAFSWISCCRHSRMGKSTEGRGWTKLGVKKVTAILSTTSRISFNEDDLMTMNPFVPNFDIMLLTCASVTEFWGLFYTLMSRKKSGFDKPYIEVVRNIRGARFQLVQPPSEDTASQRKEDEILKILDVDGEIVHLSQPSCEIRLHPQFLPVFTSKEHLQKTPPPS
ncbi:hypothetical protein ACOMHN_006499 [Nucella lapillus]